MLFPTGSTRLRNTEASRGSSQTLNAYLPCSYQSRNPIDGPTSVRTSKKTLIVSNREHCVFLVHETVFLVAILTALLSMIQADYYSSFAEEKKESDQEMSRPTTKASIISPSKQRAMAAGSAGLSELSKQLRILQAKNEAQSVEINRLERQLRILAELQGISVADLRKALEDACANEAFGELQHRVAKLRAELEAATLAKQREQSKSTAAPHIANCTCICLYGVVVSLCSCCCSLIWNFSFWFAGRTLTPTITSSLIFFLIPDILHRSGTTSGRTRGN